MTTDVAQARQLAAAAAAAPKLAFMVNNTGNWRAQRRAAHDTVAVRRRVGAVQHVQCAMHSALLWLFDDAANVGWTTPTGSMVGNGFAWGQLSHLLAWVFKVTALTPASAFCSTSWSAASGADLSDSAVIVCEGGASIFRERLVLRAGERARRRGRPLGKKIGFRIFGDEGSLTYEGYDQQPASGRLDPRAATAPTTPPTTRCRRASPSKTMTRRASAPSRSAPSSTRASAGRTLWAPTPTSGCRWCARSTRCTGRPRAGRWRRARRGV